MRRIREIKRLQSTHIWLLLGSIAIGTWLRFTNLTAKPLWTDEFATIVFSLGHSFQTIPLNQVISSETLLQPLQMQTIGSLSQVLDHLMRESTHPPLYFGLANLWMRLFASVGMTGAGVMAARSLAALLGVLAIPGMFGLGWVASRSVWVAQLTAALMAVSPFGISLAQEARHYTLAVLWVLGSLAGLAITLRQWQARSRLPCVIAFAWVAVNALGMATHYFFALTLGAEGLTLGGLWLIDRQTQAATPRNPVWRRVAIVALGTLIGSLVWVPALQSSRDSDIAQWIYGGETGELAWLSPIAHTIASLVTMLALLPIQDVSQPLMLASVAIILLLSLWIVRQLVQAWRVQVTCAANRRILWGLGGFVGVAIVLLLWLDYGFGTDLTRGLRYNFIYFPAVLLWVGFSLTSRRQTQADDRPPANGKLWTIGLLLSLGLLGSLTVVYNYGFQKVHRPDLVVARMEAHTQAPRLIAIPHHTHGQTGRLMGLAWELRGSNPSAQFYLDHQSCDARDQQRCDRPTQQLRAAIAQQPRPADLWLINYQAQPNLSRQACKFDKKLGTRRVDGYKYQHYFCAAPDPSAD